MPTLIALAHVLALDRAALALDHALGAPAASAELEQEREQEADRAGGTFGATARSP